MAKGIRFYETGGPGQAEVAVERCRANAGTHRVPPYHLTSEQGKATVRIGTAFHGGRCHSKSRQGAEEPIPAERTTRAADPHPTAPECALRALLGVPE